MPKLLGALSRRTGNVRRRRRRKVDFQPKQFETYVFLNCGCRPQREGCGKVGLRREAAVNGRICPPHSPARCVMSHGEIDRFSVFEPKETRGLTRAYEDAWKQVDPMVSGRAAEDIAALKARMAAAILALADAGERRHDVLVASALAAVGSDAR